MATITLEYCGMEGSGRTVKEAKQQATRRIEKALDGRYTPELLTLGDAAYLLWREPRGDWHSGSVCYAGEIRNGQPCGSCGDGDYETCKAGAVFQLAMNAWHGPADNELCLAYLPAARRQDFRSWIGFQMAYRHAKASDPDALEGKWHQWACDHSREFAPVESAVA